MLHFQEDEKNTHTYKIFMPLEPFSAFFNQAAVVAVPGGTAGIKLVTKPPPCLLPLECSRKELKFPAENS